MRKFTAALILVVMLTLVACDSGGSGGGAGFGFFTPPPPPAQSSYDIQANGPAATGVQVDRAFSVTLNFFQPGTATPQNVISSTTITASVLSGPGTLSGTTSLPGTGNSSLTFAGLLLNAQGNYVLSFTGTGATAPGQTISFAVGPQRDLAFTAMPTNALVGNAFTVTVQTIDPATSTPAAAVLPINITISLNSGGGNLAGTLTQTMSSGTSVAFPGLTYNQAAQITLRATAAGFPDAVSAPFTVDQVVLAFGTVPTNILVNGTFSLTVNLTGQISGTALAPNPAISATLTKATGAGNLTGNTTANSSGSTVTFTNLKYDQTGNATFTASSASAASVTTGTVAYGVDLLVTASGATSTAPGGTWSPFNFRVVDGTGATWTGAVSNLAWQITDSSSAVIQSNTAVFASGIAAVTPAPINTSGSYTLTGNITSPNNDSANIGLTVTSVTYINSPGPFVALKTVRVNNPFSDSVAFAAPNTTTGYAVMSGTLPAGLSLNTSNGAITGTPTTAGSYEFSLHAVLPGNQAQQIRCALAVFSTAETEIVTGQSFSAAGPHTTTGPVNDTYTFTSAYDGINYAQSGTFNCRIQYYYPNFATAPSPAPVLVHHRGRGFNMIDYDLFGAHVASYGIIFITIEDYQSFVDGGQASSAASAAGTSAPTTSAYDGGAAERGQASASSFQEGVMQWALAKNTQTGHALQNRVDVENIFMSGHSRGGGATHTSHFRSAPHMFNGTQRQNINIKGTIYFMAFDMRYFVSPVAGSSVMYAIPTAQPRLPSLIIAAENDGDLIYPICDEFIDRATGPTTFATIYGGVHAFLSDAGTYDAGAAYQCTRQQQLDRMNNLVVAFIKRWSELTLSLDGLLYCNEKAGSAEVGVCAYRNMAERVTIEDNQDSNTAVNNLGGSNTISGGSWTSNTYIYPLAYSSNHASLNMRHGLFTLPASTTTTWASNIPSANQDLSRCRRVMFRSGTIDIGAQTLKGYDFVTFQVRLTDTANDQATVTLFDTASQNSTYLPNYDGTSTGRPYDRFVDGSVLLSAFTTANPQLSLNQLTRVEFIFTTAAGVTRQLYFDDLRFE